MSTLDPSKLDISPVLECPGCVVLLVEDGDLNRIVARELLSRRGIQVVVAGSGPEALAQLAARRFDAVLMDVHMPGMDGLETTRAIRGSAASWASVPVIAMTAATSHADIERCLAAGMNAHVGKPFDCKHLVGVLARFTAPAASSRLADSSRPAAQVPQPRPPARQQAWLPVELPGIAVAEGCARVRNDEAAYLDILGMFQRRYADAARILGEPAAAESPQLFELAHSLISTAGLIGANTLSGLAGELQSSLAAKDRQASRASIQRVAAELAVVLASAGRLCSVPAEPSQGSYIQEALPEPGSA